MRDDLADAIAKAGEVLLAEGASEVYVLGSVITGRFREGSDIDLAVRGLPPERFYRAMGLAGNVLDRPLTLVDLDEDTPFTRYLETQGALQRVG